MMKINKGRRISKIIISISILFSTFFLSTSVGQSISAAEFQRRLSHRTSDFTYISATAGIPINSDVVPLIFEARLVPWVYIYSGNKSWDISLAPQTMIRMFKETSNPVSTPSYMPRVRFNKYFRSHNKLLTVILSHHSNGQQGDFFLDDGETLNLNTGNFSTNFFKFSFFSHRNGFAQTDGYNEGEVLGQSWIEWIKWIEVEVPFLPGYAINREEKMNGLYSFYRVGAALQTAESPAPLIKNFDSIGQILPLEKFQTRTEITWRLPFGLDQQPKFIDQLDISFTLLTNFINKNDFSLFLNYYRGQDYYNMRFQEKIHVVRFGIIANIGNFRLTELGPTFSQ